MARLGGVVYNGRRTMTLDACPAHAAAPAAFLAFDGRDGVLARLDASLRAEHALIVQLMSHGYRMRDEDTLHVLEGISRQDMRHFKWLAEFVVRLGGQPTLERGPVELAPAAPHVWLNADVAAVEARLADYREQLDGLDALTSDSPVAELRDLLQRILGDKAYHHERLRALAAAWAERREAGADPSDAPAPADPATAEAPPMADVDEATKAFLAFAIGHEYEVILQYLHHAFLLEDQYASRVLEDVAIEEMRHLGWLSETLIERGGCPTWEARRLELHDDAVRMLELDQQREIEVEADYAQMTAAMTDPAIRALFDRIGGHERFHGGTIGRLIERLKAQRPPEPLAGAIGAPVATEPPPVPPARAGTCPYTVGSLFGVPQP